MSTRRIILYVVIFFICMAPACFFMKSCSTATRVVNNGIETAYQQFKPEELLRKYEWFKDASAQLDQKLATLDAYKVRFNDVKQSYGADSTRKAKWQRADIEQWNIWQSEYLGVKASYNSLASEYNAAMSKFNYAFCNAGQMPASSMTPLPREFKPYISI